MDTLYCFKVNPEDGEIKKITIPEYTVKNNSPYTSRKTYTFNNNINSEGKFYYLSSEKIDRYVSNKLFTFDSSMIDAVTEIINTLETKSEKLRDDLRKNESILAMVKRGVNNV